VLLTPLLPPAPPPPELLPSLALLPSTSQPSPWLLVSSDSPLSSKRSEIEQSYRNLLVRFLQPPFVVRHHYWTRLCSFTSFMITMNKMDDIPWLAVETVITRRTQLLLSSCFYTRCLLSTRLEGWLLWLTTTTILFVISLRNWTDSNNRRDVVRPYGSGNVDVLYSY